MLTVSWLWITLTAPSKVNIPGEVKTYRVTSTPVSHDRDNAKLRAVNIHDGVFVEKLLPVFLFKCQFDDIYTQKRRVNEWCAICEWQINRDCHQHAFSPFRVETFTFHGKNFSRAWVFYSVLIFFFFFFFAHERTPVIAHHFHRCIRCVGNNRPWPPIEYHNFENRSRVSPSGSVSFILIFIRQSYRMISLLRFRKTFGRFPAEGVSAKIESLFIAPLILSIFGLFSYSIMWGNSISIFGQLAGSER